MEGEELAERLYAAERQLAAATARLRAALPAALGAVFAHQRCDTTLLVQVVWEYRQARRAVDAAALAWQRRQATQAQPYTSQPYASQPYASTLVGPAGAADQAPAAEAGVARQGPADGGGGAPREPDAARAPGAGNSPGRPGRAPAPPAWATPGLLFARWLYEHGYIAG